jgi:hypothetical protein
VSRILQMQMEVEVEVGGLLAGVRACLPPCPCTTSGLRLSHTTTVCRRAAAAATNGGE